jgi:hypothetical protein
MMPAPQEMSMMEASGSTRLSNQRPVMAAITVTALQSNTDSIGCP